MKRITVWILAAAMILSQAACSNKKNNIENSSASALEEVEGGQGTETTSKEEQSTTDKATEEETAQSTENTESTESTESVESTENTEKVENVESTEAESTQTTQSAQTPLEQHGELFVDGVNLVDEYGEKFQLYGMSTHGIAWFPQYVSYETFKTLRDDWNTNCVRLAMYTAEYNGFCTGGDKEELKQIIDNGVSYATDLGMYVIIDWHVLNDNDPNVYKAEAIEFFDEMSAKYADSKNIIYEICNEPNGQVSWESVKAYANEVIPVIRKNNPDAVIIVGTPTWSQDIDKALENPLEYDNVMYALHFYAATHTDWLRSRVTQCIDAGLPVFISEFGICDSSGSGAIDYSQAEEWFSLIENYNLSYCCWNLSNKAETSSVIGSWCNEVYGWSEDDLSEAGKWIRNQFRSEQ